MDTNAYELRARVSVLFTVKLTRASSSDSSDRDVQEGRKSALARRCNSRLEMTRRRMPAEMRLLFANRLCDDAIQTQRFDGCAPHRTDACNAKRVPPKVETPRVASRIEDSNEFTSAWIRRALPRAFPERARNTRESEISENGSPTRVKRNDMIDVERGFLAFLSQAAVFTPVLRAPNNLLPQACRNGHEFRLRACLRARLADAATTEDPRGRPSLRLRDAQRQSTVFFDLACPTKYGAVALQPWAVAAWRGHSAIPSRIEFACSYASKSSARTLHAVNTLSKRKPSFPCSAD